MELKLKTKTGHITSMEVAEILEVDGKPYQSADAIADLRDAVIHLEGRVQAIETIVAERSR